MKLYDWIIIVVIVLLIGGIINTNEIKKLKTRQAEINRALNMVEEMRLK